MDLRPFIPRVGTHWLVPFKNGPYDGLGLWFDDVPREIVLNGAVYELVYQTLHGDLVGDECTFYFRGHQPTQHKGIHEKTTIVAKDSCTETLHLEEVPEHPYIRVDHLDED